MPSFLTVAPVPRVRPQVRAGGAGGERQSSKLQRHWRGHAREQAAALYGILREVGYADALLARETPDGLMLIDGHLRADTTPDCIVPVLVLDVTEEEADKILLTLDPLVALATVDEGNLR